MSIYDQISWISDGKMSVNPKSTFDTD